MKIAQNCMENKGIEIKQGKFSYDSFIDGKEIQRYDMARKSSSDPIPTHPVDGDLWYSKKQENFYRFSSELKKWQNFKTGEMFTTFSVKLMQKNEL